MHRNIIKEQSKLRRTGGPSGPKALTCVWPFWPQGHNVNKLGRSPLEDAINQISRL